MVGIFRDKYKRFCFSMLVALLLGAVLAVLNRDDLLWMGIYIGYGLVVLVSWVAVTIVIKVTHKPARFYKWLIEN